MKKAILTILFLGLSIFMFAQNSPNVGDELIIKTPSSQSYKHIKFPRLNFLIKRGLGSNYKKVLGNKVIIDEIIDTKNGNSLVVLSKKDKTPFFRGIYKVKANYTKAIDAAELVASKI